MAKKYFTKALSLGLALVMCLSLLPMAAFADEGVDEGMTTPSIYDEVIQAAGDAVDAAEKAAEAAQKAADEAANKLIDAATDKATEEVGQQTKIVGAANGVIDSAAAAAEEHANTAAEAKGTVESASSTMEEKEAALLIAQDAAQRAADAAKQAQIAWETANDAVAEAEAAVAEAEAEYQRILDGHNDRDGISDTEFKAKLAAAQEKLAAAQADLNGKDEANKTAAKEAGVAKEAAEKAQDAYENAKTASGFDGNRIENVADKQSKLGEGDKTLAQQTQDVKDAKTNLDNKPDTTDAENAVNTAQSNLNTFDGSALEGKDETQTRTDYVEAQKKLEELQGQTENLDAKRQECWDAYTPVNKEWNELNGQITTWENDDTEINGVEFNTSGFSKWNNETLKDAVDTWKNKHELSYFARMAFDRSNYSTRTKDEFMQKVCEALEGANMPNYARRDTLTPEKERLYNEWDEARQAVVNNGTAIGKKQTEVDELKNLVGKFDELNRLQGALTDAKGVLDGLNEEIAALQGAYNAAVKELLKAMGAEEGDYGQGQHDKLVNDAEKLNEAIGALNDLNAKTQAQEAAEKAAAAADKAFQDASDAMTEANRVLNIAKDALDNASPECSLKTLEELKADLAVKQAAFNKVKAEFDEKEAIKNQANANAEKAAKDAEDAQNALNRIIAGLAGGSTGTGVTIDDQAIPLASGPVTCAQFIDYLWRHEGSPAVAVNELFADHEFAPAITWALSYELIDETFEPDELVTVADVRAILGAFAGVFGTNAAAVSGLTTLSGDEGEAVLNCDEVLAEFFGEEYVPAEDSDIEIAA